MMSDDDGLCSTSLQTPSFVLITTRCDCCCDHFFLFDIGDSYTLSFLVSLRSPFIHAGLIASRVKHLLNVVSLIDDNSSEVHSTGEECRIRQDYNYSLRWMSDQLSCLIVHCYVFRFS